MAGDMQMQFNLSLCYHAILPPMPFLNFQSFWSNQRRWSNDIRFNCGHQTRGPHLCRDPNVGDKAIWDPHGFPFDQRFQYYQGQIFNMESIPAKQKLPMHLSGGSNLSVLTHCFWKNKVLCCHNRACPVTSHLRFSGSIIHSQLPYIHIHA